MHNLPIHNTYALLALFLAPNKGKETRTALKQAIHNEELEWESLLLQANIQMCTPLWFACLKRDGLLQYLPQELQQYLQVLYEANEERNRALQTGLSELLSEFKEEGIETIQLKGTATFIDDLYSAAGARYMGDMDILVKQDKLNTCEFILKGLQYIELLPEDEDPHLDHFHHHINRRIKPGTPLAVEIHFKPASAQSGRLFSLDKVWEDKLNVVYRELPTALMDPTTRILLNTTHALIPGREFISGGISLRQLAEFSALATRYQQQIDWRRWYQSAISHHLKTEFISYLSLAHHLMGVPWPSALPGRQNKGFHYKRIVASGGALAQVKGIPAGGSEAVVYLMRRLYFLIKLPGWTWKNTIHVAGVSDIPLMVYRLVIKAFSVKVWVRVFVNQRQT